eukprot:CAMPEP_0174727410 /NCGR_PEP_ID=MMETSP1094-20130205/49738_1 /TAXON_ID=156173 /ORGANISM="Chrysochromulina brevifilum, Strain UTEX LB 985" /LENGTH=54 /DNA_ID=CAMNT_0015929149 /DNA_START=1 /DNA_END=161 /DNA_ORIENTATION=-
MAPPRSTDGARQCYAVYTDTSLTSSPSAAWPASPSCTHVLYEVKVYSPFTHVVG